ncbi:MAG: hypothetical protein GPJ54_15305 [Candidatus Heimdallarchaeota archaeon]|nr:hypothetical protein [Candidatus Heimdallarchaeota archaeon]
MTKLLAVYGTLKKGYHNHEVHLKDLITRFEGFVTLPFQLYSNGRYPMLVKSQYLSDIFIEVYEVSDDKFVEIIKLEEPFGYHYEKIEIMKINEFVEVFVYSSGIPPEEFTLIESGNWVGTIPWN